MTDDPAAEESDEPRVAGIACADPALAAVLSRVLDAQEIPNAVSAREDGRGIVALPASLADRALRIVLALPGLVLDRSGEPFVRRADAAKDDVLFSHPVLELSLDAIRARGGTAYEELAACVLRGSPPISTRALLLFERLGPEGWPWLDRLLLGAIRDGNAPLTGALLRAGRGAEGRAECGLPASLSGLLELARSSDAGVRRLGIRALAAIRAHEAAPLLAEALLDDDPEVAIEADDAFLEWGAADAGFDPDLEEGEKRAIAALRRAFRPKGS